MRAFVVSDYDTTKVARILKKHGFVLSSNPDLVFTYGGDGTILDAEKKFPGVPIVPIQNSRVCSKCRSYFVYNLSEVLETIKNGNYKIVEEPKAEALFKGKKIHALNEVQIHSSDPRKAIRFSFYAGNKKYKEVIGDGIVIATPYGSTGYYQSIGYKPFTEGLRAGFNNIWPRLPFVQLNKCKIRILRESAWVAADNFFLKNMKEGESIIIRKSSKKARFVVLN